MIVIGISLIGGALLARALVRSTLGRAIAYQIDQVASAERN